MILVHIESWGWHLSGASWCLLQVPVTLQPGAWWQHAIGAVASERRDLLRQEAGRRLPAAQRWRLQRQYAAAYLKAHQSCGWQAVHFGWKARRGLRALQVQNSCLMLQMQLMRHSCFSLST